MIFKYVVYLIWAFGWDVECPTIVKSELSNIVSERRFPDYPAEFES